MFFNKNIMNKRYDLYNCLLKNNVKQYSKKYKT